MKYLYQLIIIIALFVTSCSGDEPEDFSCFGFDIKQCATDPWLEFDDLEDEQSLIDKTTSYLESQGLELDELTIDMDFHRFVCEACDVCPIGPRVFIKLTSIQEEALGTLPLLGLEIEDCSKID